MRPIPGIWSASSLSRKRIFPLQVQTGVIVLRTVTNMRSSGPLPRNLLRVLVVERWAEQVVQQQEGSPPHLGPLITILKFSFAEKSKTANREKKKGETWASASLLFMSEGTGGETSGGVGPAEKDAFTDSGREVQPLYLVSSRTPDMSHGFHDCFPQSPRQSTAGQTTP